MLDKVLFPCTKFRAWLRGYPFSSSLIPSIIPIPRAINSATTSFREQLGRRGFRDFPEFEGLAMLVGINLMAVKLMVFDLMGRSIGGQVFLMGCFTKLHHAPSHLTP
jgi:hypothetical protein